jgi:uncharacterized membrane protein
MTLKTFKSFQVVVAIALGIIFSQAVIARNFVIPLIAAIVGVLMLLILRRRVKEVIADERDWANGGRSALLALQVYSWVAVIAMIILLAWRDTNPAYEPIAMTLAFSTCGLMLLYSAIFKIRNRTAK